MLEQLAAIAADRRNPPLRCGGDGRQPRRCSTCWRTPGSPIRRRGVIGRGHGVARYHADGGGARADRASATTSRAVAVVAADPGAFVDRGGRRRGERREISVERCWRNIISRRISRCGGARLTETAGWCCSMQALPRRLDELPVAPELVIIAARAATTCSDMPPRRRRARRRRCSCFRPVPEDDEAAPARAGSSAAGDRAGRGVADGRAGIAWGRSTPPPTSASTLRSRGASVARGSVWRSARTSVGLGTGAARTCGSRDGSGCRSSLRLGTAPTSRPAICWSGGRRTSARPRSCSTWSRSAIRNGSCESPSAC